MKKKIFSIMLYISSLESLHAKQDISKWIEEKLPEDLKDALPSEKIDFLKNLLPESSHEDGIIIQDIVSKIIAGE